MFAICSFLCLVVAAASEEPLSLSDAITRAEHAVLLHNDRTVHFENALALFRDNLNANEVGSEKSIRATLISKMESLVSQINLRQLTQMTDHLNAVLQRELKRREEEENEPTAKPKSFPATASYLKGQFDPITLLGKAESLMEKWVRDVMEQELATVESEEGAGGSSNDPESEHNDENCVSTATALQEVQVALLRYSQDGIGLLDHAQGGAIVHEMTSPTYSPPLSDKDRLGYFADYIPDDLLEVLPAGWMGWNVRMQAPAASRQTILHADTRPGSCWPLAGDSGFITFRLPYAVKVGAISLDHASGLLLMSDRSQLASAPKSIKIYGYPRCDDECEGLGFDLSGITLLNEFDYDIEGPTTQTFSVDSRHTEADIVAPEGSCSATTATCSAPESEHTVAAIRVEVNSNWGSPDFTCLYRIRVHGDTIP
jgi:hypothetical protein